VETLNRTKTFYKLAGQKNHLLKLATDFITSIIKGAGEREGRNCKSTTLTSSTEKRNCKYEAPIHQI
jgi:hypothetical protein